ncbi:type II toxin-antitoxin system RelE/ParE family toxin [Methylobacter sp.]|uniref:type II toxin-antitoxin system RelE family toxin n=1 Tax=Methylobacter sp. TaxID=2051955 RepID=UPI0025F12CDD|nr:type II toxin-antitoxin system RelE/ParE family toxin [Methylobacter sp.]
MNTISWKPKALKQLEKIKEIAMRQRIYTEAQVLADFPNCQGVKKLTNHAYSYRLRVGDFRVFFEFDGATYVLLTLKR